MSQKTILITGGTKGIGRALALQFAQNGFKIIVCGRNQKALNLIKAEIEEANGHIDVYQCNLRSKSAIIDFIKAVSKTVTNIDVLVNNAGVFIPGQIQDEADGVFEQMMETNLNGTYHTTRAALPMMATNSHIFNICSTASITPYINGGSYCISKYAQYGLTKVLREELKPRKIRVTAVLPGATFTDSWSGTELPEERFLKAETIAQIVWNCYQLPKDAVVEDLLIRPMEGDIT